MARPEHLYVFAYDIVSDRNRRRAATALEETMTRVQYSVFEGRLTRDKAQKLSDRVSRFLGPEDSLRAYCVTGAGRLASFIVGEPPIAEQGDFWLL